MELSQHILPACAGMTTANIANSLQSKTAVVSIAAGAGTAAGHMLGGNSTSMSRSLLSGVGAGVGHALGTWINSATQTQQTAKYGGLLGFGLIYGGSLLGDWLGERVLA